MKFYIKFNTKSDNTAGCWQLGKFLKVDNFFLVKFLIINLPLHTQKYT